jgi:hypothetical protein
MVDLVTTDRRRIDGNQEYCYKQINDIIVVVGGKRPDVHSVNMGKKDRGEARAPANFTQEMPSYKSFFVNRSNWSKPPYN